MTEHPHHADPHAHHGPTFQLSMVIAAALGVFTLLSFVVNALVRGDNILVRQPLLPPTAGFVLILSVAVCKAVLVGMFFMHLKYDWFKLYFIIVPIFIL